MRGSSPVAVAALLVATSAALVACGGSTPARRVAPSAKAAATRPAPRAAPARKPRAEGEVNLSKAEVWRGALGERCRAIEPLIRTAAARHGIDVGLIAGVIRVESSFRPKVRSSAGALGLMQVMPSTARALKCDDLFDPESNIDCGTRVLKRFIAYYDNHLIYGLSGYNAGHRRPNEARSRAGLPTNFRYVERVLSARASYLRHGCGP